MELFLNLLMSGVILGVLYALFAYGLTIILAVTHVWHFAYASSVTISGFALWYCYAELELPFVVAVMLTIMIAGATSVGMEWGVYAPLRRHGASEATTLVASLAIMSLVIGCLLLMFGTIPKSAFPGGALTEDMPGLGFLSQWDVAVLVTGVVVVVALMLLMTRTTLGFKLRAVGSNPFRAESLGISRSGAYRIAFLIGGVVTVAPAVLLAMRQPVSIEGGLDLLALAIVAIVIGGIGNAVGALIGGVVVGVTQALAAFWLPTVWSTLILFSLLFIAMLVRPRKSNVPILDY